MQKISSQRRSSAQEILRRALPPDADIRVKEEGPAPLLRISLKGMQPIDIQLVPEERRRSPAEQAAIPVLVLRTRRGRERESLRSEGTNFIDLSGAVHIRTSGFFLDRDDVPVPARNLEMGSPSLLNPYADKASRVVRTLLASSTDRRWSTVELAEECDMAASTASRVIRELRRRKLVRDESAGQGRRSRIWVPQPEALLVDWARSYRWQDNRELRVAAPIGTPERFVHRMAEYFGGTKWALTLQAGAWLIAPHAKMDTVHAYIDPEASLEAFALARGWEPSASGKLSLLSPFYADSVWMGTRPVEGIPVVHPIQLTLDLWHYPVRGREQARELIDIVLRPTWESPGG